MNNLDAFFNPKSVVVIGASMKADSLGTAVMRNMLDGRFHGPVFPVNRKYEAVQGVFCYHSVRNLPLTPELAVICTPLRTTTMLLKQLGDQGTKAAILMGEAPSDRLANKDGLLEEITATAKEQGIRLLGPRSTGIQNPWVGLNASWISVPSETGKIALVSQSGSLASGIVAWAKNNGIGFSTVISAGEALDIELNEILDYLAADPKTRSVLLYINDIKNARHFLSAARALSRIKPVIVIKSGSYNEGVVIDHDYSITRPKQDAVYDAAFRRAGMLRAQNTDELFEAVSTLAYGKRLNGDRLAILGNGGGPARIAADTLVSSDGHLAHLSESSIKKLSDLVPGVISNPVDLGRDATPLIFSKALQILLKDSETDAVLVMYTPTAVTVPEDVAALTASVAEKSQRIILGCWLGEVGRGEVHRLFEQAKVPMYITPDKAARGFLHLVRYYRNQQLLKQIPASTSLGKQTSERVKAVKEHIATALKNGLTRLNEQDTAVILSAYDINIPSLRVVDNRQQLTAAAEQLGYPVALRLATSNSKQVKSVGNMLLDLCSGNALLQASERLISAYNDLNPGAEDPQFVVQTMERRPESLLLEAGITTDPLFGPVVHLGPGGKAAGIYGEQTVELPPLNMSLAQQMLLRSKIGSHVDKPLGGEFNANSVCEMLVAISRLAADIPEIRQLSINPILMDQTGAIALDAQLWIATPETDQSERLAIKPYPRELETWIDIKNNDRVFLRPIRPEDEALIQELHQNMSQEDLRLRYCVVTPSLSQDQIAQFLHIDYARQMTFVALSHDGEGAKPLGVVDAAALADMSKAEFSVSVRTDMQGYGLGRKLVQHIVNYCKDTHVGQIYGVVLKSNEGMINVAKSCGFTVFDVADDEIIKVQKTLNPHKMQKATVQQGGYSEDDFSGCI
ncbi:MAG: bifunctional acetate--CoA ligase family protein/GNAT family N-acetyltransferase [Motiliproteus sp.]